MPARARRLLVGALARLDEAIDLVAYRPAVVRAFERLPRWWLCDLARLSIRLDDRWETGWWDDAGIVPGEPCAACGCRASIFVIEAVDGTEAEICGWCRVDGSVFTSADLARELEKAGAASVGWRWS